MAAPQRPRLEFRGAAIRSDREALDLSLPRRREVDLEMRRLGASHRLLVKSPLHIRREDGAGDTCAQADRDDR
jgi:hypothetical protein